MANLQELYLEGNAFTGDLTSTAFAANLQWLTGLDLLDNAFTSTDGIPLHFFRSPNLLLLYVAENQLAGMISDTIPVGSPLGFLAAYQNNITGTVHTTLTSLANLRHVYLSNNQLTGD